MKTNMLWDKKIRCDKNLESFNFNELNIDQLSKLLTIPIENFFDFLIISDEKEEEQISKEDFDKFMKRTFGSKSNYEASCNELRIVDYISKKLTIQEQYLIGKLYIQCLNLRLTLMTEQKIYYLFSINDEIITVRFYQNWIDSPSYLSGSLEEFDEPVAMYSSEELPINHRE